MPKSVLGELDGYRDDVFLLIFSLADIYVARSKEGSKVKEAAVKLQEILQKYSRKIVDKHHYAETALIDSFMDDCQAEMTDEARGLIPGLEDALTALDAAQSAFKQAQAARDHFLSHRPKTATELTPGYLDFYNNVFLQYAAIRAYTDKGEYLLYYEDLCQVVDHANAVEREHRKAVAKLNRAKKEAEDLSSDVDENQGSGVNDVTPDAEVLQDAGSEPDGGASDESRPMV